MSRPAWWRAADRSRSWTRSRVPPSRQAMKYQETLLQGGKSWGSARHWEPVRVTYSRPLTISRRSYLAGRPPGLGLGTKSSITDHWSSVRSDGSGSRAFMRYYTNRHRPRFGLSRQALRGYLET